jgi:hypothetical protein
MVGKMQHVQSKGKTTYQTTRPVQRDQAAPAADTGPSLVQQVIADHTQAAPADILALQRAAGNRVVSRLLTDGAPRPSRPIVQPKLTVSPANDHYEAVGINRRTSLQRTIQRQPLSADQMMATLEKIDFVKQKLQTAIHKQQMRAQVAAAMQKYETNFGAGLGSHRTKNAMMLAMLIDSVARVIAEELLDPFSQKMLAQKMFELFRPDIERELVKAMVSPGTGPILGGAHRQRGRAAGRDTAEIMSLAGVLVSGNPIAQYMHNEIRLEVAAQKIIDMAAQANMGSPMDMFRLLNERFQAEMSIYTKQQIEGFQQMGVTTDQNTVTHKIGGIALGMYTTKEAPGELSTQYFEELFGPQTTQPAWKSPAEGRGLKLSDTAQARLDKLKSLVLDTHAGRATSEAPQFPFRRGLASYKQERHLREIEESESAEAGEGKTRTKEEEVTQYLEDTYLLAQDEAQTLMETIRDWLRNGVPLTITRNHTDVFGGGVPTQARLAPSTAQIRHVTLQELFQRGGSETVRVLPKWVDAPGYEPRGSRYAIFREYKDRLMTSLLNFESADMPVFGAVNPGWATTRGTDVGYDMGKSYYGDMHFLLYRNKLKDRVVYTATDFGQPRRDPFLAFHDLAFGGKSAARVYLKGKDVKRYETVNAIVQAVTREVPVKAGLRFEIQIFGPVDVATDVREIYFANDVPQAVFDNAVAFKNQPGTQIRTVARVGSMPRTIVTVGASSITGGPRSRGISRETVEKVTPVTQLESLVQMSKIFHLQEFSTKVRHLMDPSIARDVNALKLRHQAVKSTYMNRVERILNVHDPSLQQLQTRLRAVYDRANDYATRTLAGLALWAPAKHT